MSMTLAGYESEGPTSKSHYLKTLPGIFVVITVVDATPVLIDIDSGSNVRELAAMHPRKKEWRHMSKPVGYAFVAKYLNTENTEKRKSLVKEIRSQMDVPCGN
jgi:hypothetical protein